MRGDKGARAASTAVAGACSASLLHPAVSVGLGRRGDFAVIAICALALVSVAGAGVLAEPCAGAVDFSRALAAPSPDHVLGCDWMGRDVAARVAAGLTTSIGVGFLGALASSIFALALAVISVLGGRRVDAAVCWLADLVMGVPQLVLTLLISNAMGRGPLGVMAAVSLTHWTVLCRVLRIEAARLSAMPYVLMADRFGAGRLEVVARHIAPGVLRQYLTGLVLMVPHVILHESSLTFLGFGLSPESASIGMMLAEALPHVASGAWWVAVFPGLGLLCITGACRAIGSSVLSLASREGVGA